jgi:hypothetical protein
MKERTTPRFRTWVTGKMTPSAKLGIAGLCQQFREQDVAFYFKTVLEFELRASRLLGRYSIT